MPAPPADALPVARTSPDKPPADVPPATKPSPTTLPAAKPAAGKPVVIAPQATAPAAPEEIASAARHTSSGQNSLIRALGLKINRVVIDPGHGGHDNGTEGPKGLLEKDLVLDVSQRLGKLIEDRMAAEVIYTRTDDTFIPLEGRTALANEKKADLFLSIHANSSSIPKIAGVETFYLNITGTRDALDLAARENASAQKSIFELQDIIKKITLHDKSEESLEFAKRIQAAMFSFSAKSIPASRDRGVKSAPFVVLIGANMPSVLAEIGFLSNAREEALLKKSDYRDKLAEALYKGIERYATGLSHFQVAARP
jgi:N-acetylmuramoyl-L-alanine amidase